MRVEANGGMPPGLLHNPSEDVADASAVQAVGNHGWTRSTVGAQGIHPGDDGASERHGQAPANAPSTLSGSASPDADSAGVLNETWGALLMELSGADGPSRLREEARNARQAGDGELAKLLLAAAVAHEYVLDPVIGGVAAAASGVQATGQFLWELLTLAGENADRRFLQLPGFLDRWIAPERAAQDDAEARARMHAIGAFLENAGRSALVALRDPEAAAKQVWEGSTVGRLVRDGAPGTAAGYGAVQVLIAARLVQQARHLLQALRDPLRVAHPSVPPVVPLEPPAEPMDTMPLAVNPPFIPSLPREPPSSTAPALVEGASKPGLSAIAIPVGDEPHSPSTMSMAKAGSGAPNTLKRPAKVEYFKGVEITDRVIELLGGDPISDAEITFSPNPHTRLSLITVIHPDVEQVSVVLSEFEGTAEVRFFGDSSNSAFRTFVWRAARHQVEGASQIGTLLRLLIPCNNPVLDRLSEMGWNGLLPDSVVDQLPTAWKTAETFNDLLKLPAGPQWLAAHGGEELVHLEFDTAPGSSSRASLPEYDYSHPKDSPRAASRSGP